MNQPAKRPTATICLSPYAGGMERDAIAIAKNMATLASNSVLIIRAGTWLHQKAQESGVTVEPIRMRTHVSFSGAIQLRRLWKKYEIGNIVFLGSSEMPTIFLSLLGLDINFIVRHGTTKHRSKKDLIHQLTWSKVKSHWCISRYLEKNVKKIFPVSGKQCFVAYISQSHKFHDIPFRQFGESRKGRLELVHVGRLVSGKGQRDAIHIVHYLQEKGVAANLTLFGDGPDREILEELIDRFQLEDKVWFKGDFEKPYFNLKFFDAFIFPSYGEGLGNSFIEALFSGISCFSYDNTVFPELYDMGFKFMMAPDGNYKLMAEEILRLADAEDYPVYLENRDLVSKRFSFSQEANILLTYLV